MSRTILFDVDGVLTLPEEVFSVVYTKSHGLNMQPFTKFFATEWSDFVTGKCDLKQHINEHPELWQWPGTPDELLDYWCKIEDVRNNELLNIIQKLRLSGDKCYVATEQEKYRTAYMRHVMFPSTFDGIFATCEIGYRKTDPKFFYAILEQLNIIAPETVLFFDDSESKVVAAKAAGINAHVYTGTDQVAKLLNSESFVRAES